MKGEISTLGEPTSELSINSDLSLNSDLLSLLDAETMLTDSLGINERSHKRMLALSFVQMAIAALDDDQAVRAVSA